MFRPIGLLCGLTVLSALLAPGTPALAVTPAIDVTPGQTVVVPVSSGFEVILDTCGQGGTIGPSGSTYYIAPDVAAFSGADTSKALNPSGSLVIDISPSADPGIVIVASWTTFHDGCYTAHGGITMTVVASSGGGGGASGGGGGGQGPSGISGAVGDVPSDGFCEVRFGGGDVRARVEGLTCDEALDILEGRSRAGDCFHSPKGPSSGRLYICRVKRQAGDWVVSLGKGAGKCSPVKYRGRTYQVYKRNVLCRYARATVRRILTNEHPYIYEFETPRGVRKWRCDVHRSPNGKYGGCVKRTEGRWIAFFPRG